MTLAQEIHVARGALETAQACVRELEHEGDSERRAQLTARARAHLASVAAISLDAMERVG